MPPITDLVNPTTFFPSKVEPTNSDGDEIFDIRVIPLQGECQTLPMLRRMEWSATNPSVARDNIVRSSDPFWIDLFCSRNSCSGRPIGGKAKEVVGFVNPAILSCQNLQDSAYNTGHCNESRKRVNPSAPPENFVSSLLYTSFALWSSIDVLGHMAVFDYECGQNTIIIAVIDFALVH
jgi:hypothetical protein